MKKGWGREKKYTQVVGMRNRQFTLHGLRDLNLHDIVNYLCIRE